MYRVLWGRLAEGVCLTLVVAHVCKGKEICVPRQVSAAGTARQTLAWARAGPKLPKPWIMTRTLQHAHRYVCVCVCVCVWRPR
ncbi:uncharacterized protein B0I36DRAFT_113377 [Microdochium trichocladiopsis]|uniref:Secreted protein n=1 Tax=Microdochium trichocladiopsis TaxID=1682393 RepID=A0A9P9BMZ7_9PEZI|nr:uncharacterized protein B0I36DRAFT_113377 [Microdochium trichocladiopsis]KAH7030736.1 hypothetical protein B0I36DRAFT_113377 [Microdochium trichocladiopsis]